LGDIDYLFTRMKRDHIKPSLPVYLVLLRAYSLKMEFRRMSELIQLMKEDKVAPDGTFYTALFHIFLNQGNTDESRNLFIMMKKENVKLAFMDVIGLFKKSCIRGDYRLARSILEEARQYADTQYLVHEMEQALSQSLLESRKHMIYIP